MLGAFTAAVRGCGQSESAGWRSGEDGGADGRAVSGGPRRATEGDERRRPPGAAARTCAAVGGGNSGSVSDAVETGAAQERIGQSGALHTQPMAEAGALSGAPGSRA